MKTLHIKVDDTLYDILLAMLKGLPAQRIEIIEDVEATPDISPVDVKQGTDTIKSFAAIDDPVAWQREMRSS